MTNDTLSDVLVRLRNAQAVDRPTVRMPYAKLSQALLELFVREGYLAEVTEDTGEAGHRELVATFPTDRPRPFRMLKRVSTPGQRRYFGYQEIKRPLQGYGLAVLSTSRGLMTDREAKRERLGGEMICIVA